MPLIVLIWFAGLIAFTLKTLGGFVYAQRLKYHKIYKVGSDWDNVVKKLSRKLNVTQKIKIYESALAKVPMLIGHLKPVILMPLGTITGLPADQVETIIAHEIAHIKRSDYLFNIIQNFIEIIFFYHPAVWWISGIIKTEREHACDDAALEACGNPVVYSWALLNLKREEGIDPDLVMTLFKKNNELLGRIKRMVHKEKNNSTYSGKLATLFIVLAFSATMFIACSSVDDYSYEEDWDEYAENFMDGDHTIKFYDDDDVYWRVKVDDGEIVYMYRDGERVPRSEQKKYAHKLKRKFRDFERDMEALDVDLSNLRVHIDTDDLEESLEGLEEDLADIRIRTPKHRYDFDAGELKRSMYELKRNLKNLQIGKHRFNFDHDWDYDFDFDFDLDIDDDDFHFRINDEDIHINMEDFEENMGKFGKVMEDVGDDLTDHNVDLEEFSDHMDDFDADMNIVGLDFHDLRKELKKLKGFILEVKEELVNDGYIDDIDDEVKLEYEDDEVYVDNRKMPDNDRRKYYELYEKHFDKSPDEHCTMNL